MRCAPLTHGRQPALALLAMLVAVVARLPRGAALPCAGVPATVLHNAKPWPASCAGTTGPCVGSCNSGYGSRNLPTSTCNTATGQWGTPTGACSRVCTTQPDPLQNGAWDPTCTGTVAMSGSSAETRCFGTCASGYVGNPSIQCTTTGWINRVGGCVVEPACNGVPPTVLNSRPWPTSCVGRRAGDVCQASCNPNYQGAASLTTSTCQNNGTWSTPSPSICAFGPCKPIIVVFDNYNMPVDIGLASTDRATTWGDFKRLSQAGMLYHVYWRVYNRGGGTLTGFTARYRFHAYDPNNPNSLGPQLAAIKSTVSGANIAPNTYTTYYSDLTAFGVQLPRDIAFRIFFEDLAGANDVGTVASSSTAAPVVGEELTTGYYLGTSSGATTSWNELAPGKSASQLSYKLDIANVCAPPALVKRAAKPAVTATEIEAPAKLVHTAQLAGRGR